MALPIEINYWAVLVSGIATFFVGMIWYSPVLFGNAWMKAGGMTKEFLEKHKKGMGGKMIVAFVGSLLMAYVLSHFVDYTGSTSFAMGMTAGFWIWIGFIVPILLGSVLWEGKSVTFYLINIAYQLVSLIVMGGILAVWQ